MPEVAAVDRDDALRDRVLDARDERVEDGADPSGLVAELDVAEPAIPTRELAQKRRLERASFVVANIARPDSLVSNR